MIVVDILKSSSCCIAVIAVAAAILLWHAYLKTHIIPKLFLNMFFASTCFNLVITFYMPFLYPLLVE